MWDSKLKIWTIRCSFVALSNNAQKNNQLLPSIRIVGWSEEDEFGLLVLHSLKNGRHIQCKIWQPWNCTPHMVHLRKQRGHLKLIKERKSAEHWCTQQSINRQKKCTTKHQLAHASLFSDHQTTYYEVSRATKRSPISHIHKSWHSKTHSGHDIIQRKTQLFFQMLKMHWLCLEPKE